MPKGTSALLRKDRSFIQRFAILLAFSRDLSKNEKGYYEAKVQVYGDKGAPGGNYVDDWVKGKKSTFFPDSWSNEKIQAEIANGIKNKVPDPKFSVSGGNIAFKSTMSDGKKLQLVYDSSNNLKSAFPNLDQ